MNLKKTSGLKLDLEMRCIYRIHNGQKPLGALEKCGGLFGGYKVYDYHINMHFCSLDERLVCLIFCTYCKW